MDEAMRKLIEEKGEALEQEICETLDACQVMLTKFAKSKIVLQGDAAKMAAEAREVLMRARWRPTTS